MRLLFFFLIFFIFSSSFSQIITFSNTNFKNKLLQSATTNAIAKGVNGNNIKIDSNNNQEIEVSEALAVFELSIANSNISDLQEISNFINLKILKCDRNSLVSLDVSMLDNLESLNCRGNDLTTLTVTGAAVLNSIDCDMNSLDSLDIQSLTSLTYLKCSGNNLHALDTSSNTGLIYLDCSNNELTSLSLNSNSALESLIINDNEFLTIDLSTVTSLQQLEARSNNLSSIDLSQLPNLRIINISQNEINQIDFSNNLQLGFIDLSSNEISTLNVSMLQQLSYLSFVENNVSIFSAINLPILNTIACDNNQLQSFTAANLPNLTTLQCSDNQITNLLISSLPNLTGININNNLISSLDLNSFANLDQIRVQGNLLTTLNVSGLSNVSYIDASNNLLTEISFPISTPFQVNFSHNNLNSVSGLKGSFVDLSYNNLTSINASNCDDLNVSHNQLTSLTILEESSIYFLDCSFNGLNVLNIPSEFFRQLKCTDNQLQSIIVPKSDFFITSDFDCSNNPNLEYICVSPEDVVLVVQKLEQVGYSNTEVNSYCIFTPGGSFYTISGNQRYNFNGSSCSTSDPIVPNLKFNITNGTVNGTIISDESGAYSIPVQAGQHTITPIVPSSTYYTVSPASVAANFPTQTSPLIQNFCITANGTFPDIEVNLIPIGSARPGFDSFYKVLVKNVGTTVQSGTVYFAYDESVSDFIEATPTSPTINAGSVSWTVSNLAPFSEQEFFVTLNHNSPMETPALNGNDLLSFSANMQTAATDSTPDNNVSTLRQVVVNSFDPNDKTCLAGPTIGPEQVGKFVNYMIRFENTGTAAAQRVIVTDRIDTAKFDISTLTPQDSSHPFTTRIYDGNRVEFIFENIQLGFTDETNDGYVVFKIKTVPTLVVGDTFSNSAAIYFDFNYPIFTNDATTEVQVLGTENFDWQKSFAVFPNPMHDELTVKSLAETVATKIEVFNTLGQLVISVVQPSSEEIVDVSRLAAGNYFVKMHSSQGIGVAKVVKQ